MNPSRRNFLKAGGGAVVASVLGFDVKPAYAQAQELKIARTTETRSTCPYCSVSCGVIIHTIGDKAKNVTPQVVHVEGDPDHPINRGTLCPKGSSLMQDILNDRRLLKPQVRRPGSDHWEDIGWDQAYRRDRAPHQEDARRDVHHHRFAGPHRESRGKHRLERRLHRHQRVQLSWLSKPCAAWGSDLPRKSGQGLTRPHGLQFGANVRTRCHDEWLDRHQEHRHDVDHGRQSGREPSVRIQVAGGSQAPAQREDDRGGSALHAHRRGGRHVPADPRRHRTSRFWAA